MVIYIIDESAIILHVDVLFFFRVILFLCFHHLTVSAEALCFWALRSFVRSFVRSFDIPISHEWLEQSQ